MVGLVTWELTRTGEAWRTVESLLLLGEIGIKLIVSQSRNVDFYRNGRLCKSWKGSNNSTHAHHLLEYGLKQQPDSYWRQLCRMRRRQMRAANR